MFVAVGLRPDSIRFCARIWFSSVYFAALYHLIKFANVYLDQARKHGKNLLFGPKHTIVRLPHFSGDKAHFH